jgi:hypothetical protein
MVAFLLIISFGLHAISLFVIILLYLQLSKVKEVEKRQSQLIKDMEHTVSAYLLEWKEENERFLKALSKNVNKRSGNAAKPSSVSIDSTLSQTTENEWPSHIPNVEMIKDKVEIRATNKHQGEQSSLPSIAEQAMKLQKEGKTVEEIAKLLKKGKTEIELLLKFRQM